MFEDTGISERPESDLEEEDDDDEDLLISKDGDALH